MKPFQELSQHIAQTLRTPSTNAILFRHGQTNQNISNTIAGWTDSILTVKGKILMSFWVKGRNQASQLFKGLHSHLNQFGGIYSSDLRRAKETARIALGFDHPFIEDRRLRETHFGKYENMAYSMLEKEIQEQIFNIDFKPPGGESYIETRNRAIEFLSTLKENKTHLIFSHGALICTLTYFIGQKESISNCSCIGLQIDKGVPAKILFQWQFPEEEEIEI